MSKPVVAFIFIFVFGCSSARDTVKVSFRINSEIYRVLKKKPEIRGKYFIEFRRVIELGQEKHVNFSVRTNFPSEISLVVSRGLFGGLKTFKMSCSEVESDKTKICSTSFGIEDISDFVRSGRTGKLFFWFMVKLGEGIFYTVPNMRIFRAESLEDMLGKIIVKGDITGN